MLNGNGQNDPADIAALLPRWHELQQGGLPYPVLITGWRDKRRNTRLRRLSSRIANGVRSSLLGDATPESARDCIGTSVGRIVLARRRCEATIAAVRPG